MGSGASEESAAAPRLRFWVEDDDEAAAGAAAAGGAAAAPDDEDAADGRCFLGRKSNGWKPSSWSKEGAAADADDEDDDDPVRLVSQTLHLKAPLSFSNVHWGQDTVFLREAELLLLLLLLLPLLEDPPVSSICNWRA